MNAIEENEFMRSFQELGKSIPKPTAILCISAHWYTPGTMVTAMPTPRTIHDFGGFPKALFEVQYPAPGSPILANAVHALSPIEIELNKTWGLDHGAWSVLKHLYPNAEVPVIQMSIDYTKPPRYHYELAHSLSSLREKGVLIIGSGNIIHNLRMVDFGNFDRANYGYDWAMEAHTMMNKWILEGDYDHLLNYKKEGKAIELAIPTPDHFLPLIYALGAQQKGEQTSLFNDQLMAGSLSMTSVRIE
ncbi:UNVERIFIED_CONTAM: hypothetical protein GTU68_013044 [Idotea baltica]|nr:hypothetical protein [Idotea baltica]